MSSSFSCKKASSCAGPHIQAFFVLISSQSGCPISAILLEKLLIWFTIPKNLRSSVSDCGAGSLSIANVLNESALTPSASIKCPKNSIDFLLN